MIGLQEGYPNYPVIERSQPSEPTEWKRQSAIGILVESWSALLWTLAKLGLPMRVSAWAVSRSTASVMAVPLFPAPSLGLRLTVDDIESSSGGNRYPKMPWLPGDPFPSQLTSCFQ
jgi:hypothetical protein